MRVYSYVFMLPYRTKNVQFSAFTCNKTVNRPYLGMVKFAVKIETESIYVFSTGFHQITVKGLAFGTWGSRFKQYLNFNGAVHAFE